VCVVCVWCVCEVCVCGVRVVCVCVRCVCGVCVVYVCVVCVVCACVRVVRKRICFLPAFHLEITKRAETRVWRRL